MTDYTTSTPPTPDMPKSNNINSALTLVVTALIFFALGGMIAYLVSGPSDEANQEALTELSVSRQETLIAQSVRQTVSALHPSPTPITLNDGTVIAQVIIDQAVQATFIALTPTATPLPTDVPREFTFVVENPALGPADAPITMVEFSDYLCPFCARFHLQTLNPLMDHYDGLLRFVYREYPIIGGQASVDISVAAQCAHVQNKYWEYTDQVWLARDNQEAIDQNALMSYAQNLNLDIEAFNTCREDGTGLNMVIVDYEAGRNFNINGTPGFFIEGVRFTEGALPLSCFMDVVDAQLVKKGITPPERTIDDCPYAF